MYLTLLVFVFSFLFLLLWSYIYIYTYVHLCIYIYIYIYIHMYVHICWAWRGGTTAWSLRFEHVDSRARALRLDGCSVTVEFLGPLPSTAPLGVWQGWSLRVQRLVQCTSLDEGTLPFGLTWESGGVSPFAVPPRVVRLKRHNHQQQLRQRPRRPDVGDRGSGAATLTTAAATTGGAAFISCSNTKFTRVSAFCTIYMLDIVSC